MGALIDSSFKVGLLLAVLAVSMLTVSVAIGDGVGLAIATVAGPLLTIAIVNFVFDPLAKSAVFDDLQGLLTVDRQLRDAGVRGLVPSDSTRTADLLEGARTVIVLPWHPLQWVDRDFDPLCRRARDEAIEVRVLVPAYDGPGLESVADRTGVSRSVLEGRLKTLADELCAAWDQVGVAGDSTLKVLQYSGTASVGLMSTSRAVAVDVGPAVRRIGLSSNSQLFVFARPSDTAASVDEQIKALVDDASVIGVRPISSPTPGVGSS